MTCGSVLQTADPRAKLTELFEQRDPLYRQVADISVQSGKQSVQALMLHLMEEIEAFRRKNTGQGAAPAATIESNI